MKRLHQKGEISLIMIPLSLILISFFYFGIYHFTDTTKIVTQTQNSYLCMASHRKEALNAIKKITMADGIHKTLIPLTYVPKVSLKARQLIKLIKLGQEITLKQYQTRIMNSEYCLREVIPQLLHSFPLGVTKVTRSKSGLVIFLPHQTQKLIRYPIFGIKFKRLITFTQTINCKPARIRWSELTKKDKWN